LQTLVDDDLVHQEKIGISNYFWSFPAEATVQIESQRKRAEAELVNAKALQEELATKVEQAKQGKQASQQRAEKMAEMRALQLKLQQLQQELVQYKENDPETVEAYRQATVVCKEAANRWLDNLFSMKSWAKRQFPNNDEELNKFFQEQGLTDTLEYVE
jgi:seryl-tRNA synthetase